MEQILQYIKPELLVLVIVLYFLGKGIGRTEKVDERYLPLLLGIFGIALCAVWVAGTSRLRTVQEAAAALFTALVQGVLVTGLAVWALHRTGGKKEEK